MQDLQKITQLQVIEVVIVLCSIVGDCIDPMQFYDMRTLTPSLLCGDGQATEDDVNLPPFQDVGGQCSFLF